MFGVRFLALCSFDAPTCICELSYTFPGSILLPVGLVGWWVFFERTTSLLYLRTRTV
jgi:hypothetical protein